MAASALDLRHDSEFHTPVRNALALFSATLVKHGRGHAPNATLDDAFTQLAAEVLRHRHDHQRMASAAEDRTRRQALRAQPRPAAARTWSPRQVPQPAATRS